VIDVEKTTLSMFWYKIHREMKELWITYWCIYWQANVRSL